MKPLTHVVGRELVKGQSLLFTQGVIRVTQVTAWKAWDDRAQSPTRSSSMPTTTRR